MLGAMAAAALAMLVPPSWTDSLAGHVLVADAVLTVLAVLLAMCSEADAFVAASLSALPLDGRDLTLTGFAVRRGFAVELVVLTISCCAADA